MNYEEALYHILSKGIAKEDRTGTGTLSVFGLQIRYNLSESFPLITSKKVHFKSVVEELLWFLRGETNTKTLNATIWDEWADSNGELGPVYGKQWRKWESFEEVWYGEQPSIVLIDQIAELQESLKNNPDSRRHIVSAWNPSDLDKMALPPCHYSFQCYVSNGKLSILVNQRSADMFLGVPFNLASYATLCHLLADVCDYGVGELIWNGGDCHIYSNHLEQVKEQLARIKKPLPQLRVSQHHENVWDYSFDDLDLIDYEPHPAIKGEVAV